MRDRIVSVLRFNRNIVETWLTLSIVEHYVKFWGNLKFSLCKRWIVECAIFALFTLQICMHHLTLLIVVELVLEKLGWPMICCFMRLVNRIKEQSLFQWLTIQWGLHFKWLFRRSCDLNIDNKQYTYFGLNNWVFYYEFFVSFSIFAICLFAWFFNSIFLTASWWVQIAGRLIPCSYYLLITKF